MKEVRTVIWDCDGVMWFHKKEEPQIISEALGIDYCQEFYDEFWDMIKGFNSYFADKKATKVQFYKIIEQEMPILYFHRITPKKFLQVWNDLKLKINDFNQDVLTVMKYLQEKNIKNIIKTDFWQNMQIGLLKEFGIFEYIERLYCCDNRYLKCNPLSAKEIIKPGTESEFVIIGDSLSSDIVFAKHAGIKSIWFNKNGEKKNETSYKPDFEVFSLLEVMDYFK